RIARLERVAQRHHSAVYARADQVMAHLRVNSIREVDNGRALREVEQITLGREDEDFFGKEVVLDGREEFLRIVEVLLPLDKSSEPREALGLAQLGGAALLVVPMRRDSLFGHLMHLARADLHLP